MSQHSLHLDEEEQLQLALALSAHDAPVQTTSGITDDERIARQLQARRQLATTTSRLHRS